MSKEERNISELKVLKSAAGYYLGREVIKDDTPMPYDRQSDYFSNAEDADRALKTIKKEPQNILPEVIEQHGKELDSIITNELKEKNGQSYLSKEQVELMLENHFKRVENLLEFYSQQYDKKGTPISEWIEDFQSKLKDMTDEFKESIISKVLEAKQSLTDNVQNRINAVRDTITEVKERAFNKVQNFVLGINEKIKGFAEKIDSKFEKEQLNELDKRLNDDTSEIGQLRKEIEALKSENKIIRKEKDSFREKLGTLEKFFSEDKSSYKNFNDFLAKQNEPSRKDKEVEKEKVLAGAKKPEQDFDL